MNVLAIFVAMGMACCVKGASIYITESGGTAVKSSLKHYAFSLQDKTARAPPLDVIGKLNFAISKRNDDSVFSPTEFEFEAPVKGLYELYFGAVSGAGELTLTLHSPEKGDLATASAGATNSQAFNMVQVELDKDDKVWVNIGVNQDVKACDPGCSTFAGRLLYQID